MSAAGPIVQVRDLRVRFNGEQTVHAVNGVDFDLRPGEVLGILGESGSGKSVTLKALMRLLPERRAAIEGSIRIDGHDVLSLPPAPLADFRGKTVSMIFQEPMLALDPVFTIGHQIAESVQRHDGVDRRTAEKRALEMLERVRIPSPARRLKAYPHEMSGGMRQRAMIALALACRPKVLLADEPTTALDATVQIQILLLLRELQREFGMAVIFVTHDIGAAIEVSDQVAVMYAGRFVETGPVAEVLGSPGHPYTKGLLASTVHGAMRGQRLEAIPGAPPSLIEKPVGCSFAPRCGLAMSGCDVEAPPTTALSAAHGVRCWAVTHGGLAPGAEPQPAARDAR
jgi:peptide/nickel transport system ATP-binding protein